MLTTPLEWPSSICSTCLVAAFYTCIVPS